ncbi:MAG: DNA repair protein RadC [Dysgonamonadaceae bacterium]|jgi:DNA repair protein RadC|nr:DNA repair protein RadC [Dysgonamonadaceae bacterium]
MTTTNTKLSIKDWAEEDRPREKILLKGISALSDAELLAIIIGSGNNEESAVELSQRILFSADNNLNILGKFSIKELISGFKGIGEAKAISIVAAMELGKRRKYSEIINREQIRCSRDIFECFHPMLCDLQHEEFWILVLNRTNKIIDKIKISQGGVTQTVVDHKLILKEALSRLASGIVLCHNHPSGNKRPGKDDDSMTKKIIECCRMFEIYIFDHIIIADNDYYSYADEGRIPVFER